MKKTTSAFTIVELVVVITVIAILTAIITLGFLQQQAKSRDSERLAAAKVITEDLEKYYDKNGEYPPCTAMTDTATNVSNNTLWGIDKTILVAPQDTTGTTNSIQCNDMTSASQPDFYAYVGDGSTNCQTGNSCLSFSLKYKIESTGQIGVINSRRSTNIATSGTPTLTASTTGFTTANLSWTGVNNATGYTAQWATDSGFTTNLVSNNYIGVNASVSGLSYNTTYYFRIRATSSTGSFSSWSPTQSITTWSLTAPTLSASTNSSTSFTMSWTAVPHADSYILQLSGDGVTWSSGWQYNFNGTSYTFSGGVGQGYKYYGRIEAISGAYASPTYTGPWSNVANTTTTIDPPAAYSVSASNPAWNVLRGTSNAVCPSGTTPSYDWYHNVNGTNSFWVSGTGYQTVDYTMNWNDTVSLSVASRCITSNTSSSFVWGNNTADGSLPGPSISVWGPAWRTMAWSGSCPSGTSSLTYNWFVMANSGGWSAGANGVTYTSYANTGTAWGDGDIRATVNCYGPWGNVTASGWYDFGSGCVPTITSSWCTY